MPQARWGSEERISMGEAEGAEVGNDVLPGSGISMEIWPGRTMTLG